MTTDEMSKKIDSITHKKEYIKITRLINKAERNLIFDKKDIEKFKKKKKKKAEELNRKVNAIKEYGFYYNSIQKLNED